MELTDEQKQRIEENRKKALLIRQEKLKVRSIVHPYQKYNIFTFINYWFNKIFYL